MSNKGQGKGGGGQHLTPSIVHMPLCMCNLLVQSNL